MDIPRFIAEEMSVQVQQVKTVLDLFGEGATIPFIARYRKERTGGLDEEQLRVIEDRNSYLTILQDRKATVLNSIEEQGKLTDELKAKIEACSKLQEVEDLYLPYKPKRKTRGTMAKAKGLEPLALFIIENPRFTGDFNAKLEEFIDEELGVNSIEEALQGAKDIIAEMISDTAEVRQAVRDFLMETASIVSAKETSEKAVHPAKAKDVYEIYHDFKMELNRIKPYQLLAINRGERENFLKVVLSYQKPDALGEVFSAFFEYDETEFAEIIEDVVDDSFTRLIYPSIEREVRGLMTEKSDLHAIEIFASNLRQLLLQAPVAGKKIMGIDPGFASGSKVAVIDSTGKYIEGATIYPHPPQKKTAAAERVLLDYIERHKIDLIAIGNGTASRETELFVAEMINNHNLDCHYLIVNEAGASVYSASEVARQEFPDLEASQRGNISIARRVLDPLAELVKIQPKSIGVGLYQHDVDQKLLGKKLDDVVVSCVNYVGVDVNTASASLLTYVSGLNKKLARSIVFHRETNGRFRSRDELMNVSGMGVKTFEQAAGFLKVPGGDNPLDDTFIHPESYKPTVELIKEVGTKPGEIKYKGNLIGLYVSQKGIKNIAQKIGVGEPTLIDILENLNKPGRDPREEMPGPILRSDVLKMEDLEEGMVLKGTVRNIVDFGAFVDIGVKQDGLLHISRMAKKFIKSPLEVLNVADIIDVKIIEVNIEKGRISLSLVD